MRNLYNVVIPARADELTQLRAERIALHTALRALHLDDIEAQARHTDGDDDGIVLYRCKRCGAFLNNGMNEHRDWCPYGVLAMGD